MPDYKPLPERRLKKCFRGTMTEKATVADGVAIHVVWWYDSRVVSLVSIYCGVEPVAKVTRFLKAEKVQKEIECPDVVCVCTTTIWESLIYRTLLGICSEIEKQEMVLQNFLPLVRL
jgi:hypothetical protein